MTFDGTGNGLAFGEGGGRRYLAASGWQPVEAVAGQPRWDPLALASVSREGTGLFAWVDIRDQRGPALHAVSFSTAAGWRVVADHVDADVRSLRILATPDGGGWILAGPSDEYVHDVRRPLSVFRVDPEEGLQPPMRVFLDDPVAQGSPHPVALWAEADGVSVVWKQRRPIGGSAHGIWWSRLRGATWSEAELVAAHSSSPQAQDQEFVGDVAAVGSNALLTWALDGQVLVKGYASDRGWSAPRRVLGGMGTRPRVALTQSGAAIAAYESYSSVFGCRFDLRDL